MVFINIMRISVIWKKMHFISVDRVAKYFHRFTSPLFCLRKLDISLKLLCIETQRERKKRIHFSHFLVTN